MKRAIVIGLALLVFAFGAVLAWDRWPRRSTYYTDAVSIREPLATATPRDILWQPPISLPPVINSTADDYEPRMSPDGLTLYFVRGKAGHNADIFVSTRTPEGWTEPQAFAEVNSDSDDLGPEPSANGAALYFYSNRDGGSGGYDLWVTRRSADGWHEPTNLGPAVNTEYNDYGPAISPDGATLYFASNRPAASDARQPDPNAWSATLREDLFHRTYDLYSAAVTDAGIQSAVPLSDLNTPSNEGAPSVSPFGDFLYFASDRPGGEGGFDLYRARRLRGDHLAPTNLGMTVNTSANELDPGLSLGGYRLDFSSDRAVDGGAKDRPREYNIYQTTSREVFAETEELARASIDWWGLWGAIGPNLLWALLALALLLLMIWMMGGVRGRRLSLVTKCLLASLAAHLLLMLLFNTMQVASSIAGELGKGRKGPIQIALAPSSGGGQSIAAQLRAGVTEASSLEMPVVPSPMLRAAPLTAQAAPLRTVETPSPEPSLIRANLSALTAVARDAVPSSAAMPIVERSPELPHASHAVDFTALETATPSAQSEGSAQTPLADFVPVRAGALVSSQGSGSRANVAVLRASPIEASPGVTEVRPSDAAVGRHMGMSTTSLPSLTLRSVSTEFALLATADPIQSVETIPPSPRTPTTQGIRAQNAPFAATSTPSGNDLPTPRPSSATPSASLVGVTTASDASPSFSPSPMTAEMPTSVAEAGVPGLRLAEFAQPSDAKPSVADLGDTVETGAIPAAPSAPSPRAALASGGIGRTSFASAEFAIPPALKGVSGLAESLACAAEVTDEAPVRGVPSFAGGGTALQAPTVPSAQASSLALPDAQTPAAGTEASAPPVSQVGAVAVHDQPGLPPVARPRNARAEPSVPLPLRKSAPFGGASATLASFDARFHETKPLLAASRLPSAAKLESPSSLSTIELGLPAEQQTPENPYQQRFAENRLDTVEQMGGSKESEDAVARALAWLAAHQSADGHWDGRDYDRGCGECGGETHMDVDRALTGLSLLCFLGAGHTHQMPGVYQDTVDRGLRWLVAGQPKNGDLRGEETMYSHGIATIAISEAFAITADSRLREPVERAANFIVRAQNKTVGGWRYDPGQAGDTSVLGWQVMALKSAANGGVRVPPSAFDAAGTWLNRVSERKRPGLYAYQPGQAPTPSMTAEGMFVQEMLGLHPSDPRNQESLDFVLQNLPQWGSTEQSTYYWYYASLALFQRQGEAWEKWNGVLRDQLIHAQRRDGRAAGSWNPIGPWADVAGRIYQTALCTLMLEVYYRYLPLFKINPAENTVLAPEDVLGTIRGKVTESGTGRPLARATVRLNLPDQSSVVAVTEPDGTYLLNAPDVPDFFALSASLSGFVPKSSNVERARLEGRTVVENFVLEPASSAILVTEPVPDVHHLGDNRFDGTINSQFQKQSEGTEFTIRFQLGEAQLPPNFSRAEVRLMAKGVQRNHRIVINDETLQRQLNKAPEDGSFGDFKAPFDPNILKAGVNTLQVIAAPSTDDIDDFEFVNVQVRLAP